MSDPLNDLVGTAVRAWASVARAWIASANAVWVSLLDLSDPESDQLGFNEETVMVPAQSGPCAVCAGPFVDFDNTQLPAEVISVTPQALAAGVETEVCVRVIRRRGPRAARTWARSWIRRAADAWPRRSASTSSGIARPEREALGIGRPRGE